MKFKAGDHIVPIHTKPDNVTRIVIGYASSGAMVYEYTRPGMGGVAVTHTSDAGFKLAPVKTVKWMNIYPSKGYESGFTAGFIFNTEDEAKEHADPGGVTVKVEFEV